METSNDIKDIKYNNNKRKKKSFCKGTTVKELLDFFVKNVRYFAAGVLFLLMTVVVAFFMEKGEQEAAVPVDENGVMAFQENAYPEVNELIQNYYTAYAAGDIAALTTLANPFSEHELGYISVLSQYVESYQNMIYYTKPGLDTSSYMVNVYLEVKFEGVDTLAPGLDFFYVRTNEEGKLYIDNLYSLYNLENKDNPLDTNIHNLILEHQQQADLIALLTDAQIKFDAAKESDPNLDTMVTSTIPNAISDWMANIVTQGTEVPDTETIDTETPDTETMATEVPETSETSELESESEADSEGFSFPEGTVITIEEAVNVREQMTIESDLVATLYRGEKVTVVMSYAEGWTKVEWDNKTGYIRTDLLQ